MIYTDTVVESRASALTGPVSDNAPGPVSFERTKVARLSDPFWYGRGLAVKGGYIGGNGMACFRHHEANKAGCWCVDFTANGFYVSQDAVVDDFGSLVRVGKPS